MTSGTGDETADERATRRLDDGSLAALLRVGVVGALLAGWGSGPRVPLSRWLEGVWIRLAAGSPQGVDPTSGLDGAVSLGEGLWGPWVWWTCGLGALVLATGVSVTLAMRRGLEARRTRRRWARDGVWRGPVTAVAVLTVVAWAVRSVAGGARAGGLEASALEPLMGRWTVELAWVAGAWLLAASVLLRPRLRMSPRQRDRSARGASRPTS